LRDIPLLRRAISVIGVDCVGRRSGVWLPYCAMHLSLPLMRQVSFYRHRRSQGGCTPAPPSRSAAQQPKSFVELFTVEQNQ